MADNIEKIERTKKKLLAAFVEYSKIQNKIEAMRREHRRAEKTSQGLVPHSDWGMWWIKNKWNLAQLKSYADYAGDYAEFIYDAYEINRYIGSKFISDAGNYFKHPSDENLKKIQPEFKRVMNIRNQENILKEELFLSFCKKDVLCIEGKNNVFNLNISPAMYNLESQKKAYSEAVELNKDYNKGLEHKLLTKIMPSITFPYFPDQKLNVIAFACGSGIHEYEFVSEFIKQRRINEDYVYLYMTDVNQAMVEEAISNAENRNFKRMREGKKRINVRGFQLDFTKDMRYPIEVRPGMRGNIFLFLGSTLGNFGSDEQKTILGNINDAIFYNDNLIIGVKGMHYKNGQPDKERIEQEYAASENFVYSPLKIIGIERRCLGKYKAEFGFDKNKNIYDIAGLFPVIEDTEASVDEERLYLHKGNIIKVAHSQRFTKDELNGLAMANGLQPLKARDEDGYVIGIYTKKKE
jgi:hypothetical protein